MSADDTKVASLIPISKIVPTSSSVLTDNSASLNNATPDEQRPKKKGASKAVNYSDEEEENQKDHDLEAGSPNSFNKKDLVFKLQDLNESQVYYVVYTRSKSAKEISQEQQVSQNINLEIKSPGILHLVTVKN